MTTIKMSSDCRSLAIFLFVVMAVSCFYKPICAKSFQDYVNEATQHTQDARVNFGYSAQNETKASHGPITGAQDLDSRLYGCYDAIRTLFNINLSLANPFAVLVNLLLKEVAQLVDQLCQMVLSTLNAAIQSAMSIFNLACVPLPNINLNLGSMHFPTIPCNGTNLLQPQISRSSSTTASGRGWYWQNQGN